MIIIKILTASTAVSVIGFAVAPAPSRRIRAVNFSRGED
jgi:hypothetical protein